MQAMLVNGDDNIALHLQTSFELLKDVYRLPFMGTHQSVLPHVGRKLVITPYPRLRTTITPESRRRSTTTATNEAHNW